MVFLDHCVGFLIMTSNFRKTHVVERKQSMYFTIKLYLKQKSKFLHNSYNISALDV